MNIIGKRTTFFIIAAILAILAVISIAVFKINPGIDFVSGSILTVKFDQPVQQSSLRDALNTLGLQGATIQPTANGDFEIHSKITTDVDKSKLESDLTAKLGTLKEQSYSAVEKKDATAAIRNAGIAVGASIIGMLLYIAFAFRRMPNPFRFGVCAVAGLAFDLLMAVGIFSILGKVLGWEVNLMFIAGILAVLGFSINNTIIVFDRIRENTARGVSPDIEVVANTSVVQTLGRSFNTSLTALFTLVVLALFVGSSIQNFVMVMIIGVISGVYTSTCISPEMLVAWQKKEVAGRSNTGLETAKLKS